MNWKKKLAAQLEENLYAARHIRKWADQRSHLLPVSFLQRRGELERQLHDIRIKKNDLLAGRSLTLYI